MIETCCLNVSFCSTGSRTGSSSSPMFSRSIGVPNWMAFSSVRRYETSVSLMTFILLSRSMFFTHLFAWPAVTHSGPFTSVREVSWTASVTAADTLPLPIRHRHDIHVRKLVFCMFCTFFLPMSSFSFCGFLCSWCLFVLIVLSC